MVDRKKIDQGRSSEILYYLLGDVKKYVRIIEKQAKRLIRKYPNPNLASVFSILPNKLITIGPMALCDDLTQDLGGSCDEDILAAIGLSCFPITTHDDVVDETPAKKAEIAALIYAGNIAGLEGSKILYRRHLTKLGEKLADVIEENHYCQQFRVDLLWEKKPKNFQDYRRGIEDVCSLAAIGPLCALAFTGRENLEKQIRRLGVGWGVALQIIDDIRELEEDKLTDYTSFPLLEGKPFKRSFQELDRYLKIANRAIDPKWKRTRARVGNLNIMVGEIRRINEA